SLMPMLKKLGGSFDEAADALKKIKNNDSTAPPSAKTPPPPKQGLADRPARTSPTGAPPAGGKGPGTGPDTTTPAGADTPPPPKDVGAPRSGPGGGATPPPLFGAPRPPAPPTTRTGRPIVRPSAQNSTPQSAPPPRNVQPQAAPPQSAQPQSVPPHNAPPQKPQVIDASSFKTPDEANKFMQDHFGPVQQINKDKFDSKTPGHDTNCGNCTVATAHTIKTGQPYRVDPAKPMGLDDVANGSVPHGSSGKFQPFPGGYDQLSQDVANQPPGFVASVAARWPNEEVGHFFNVVKHPNGAVVYLDGQSGMPADISKKPSELYAMDYPNAPTNVSQTPAPQPNAPGATPNAPAVDTNVPAARPDTPPAQPQAPPASQQTPAPHHDLDVQMADADSPASRPGTPPAVDQDVPMSDAGGPSTSSDGDVPMEDAGSPRPSVDEDDLIE
ncbi:toxin glutamine deamidase domain-containing protein, partial [Saccharopolyspora erythraea]